MDAASERKGAGQAEVLFGTPEPIGRIVDGLLVFHLTLRAASAHSSWGAKATSALLPITTGVFWCSSAGTSSEMFLRPSVAAPPACSTNIASGAASYRRRRLPRAERESPGYMNPPPEIRLRWKSATSEPM